MEKVNFIESHLISSTIHNTSPVHRIQSGSLGHLLRSKLQLAKKNGDWEHLMVLAGEVENLINWHYSEILIDTDVTDVYRYIL